MISIAKGMTISEINKSNFLLTGIVLLAVAALFFLPELINYHPNIQGKPISLSGLSGIVSGGKESASTTVHLSPPDAVVVDAAPLSRVSPLEQIRQAIDQGYIEKLKDARRRLALAGVASSSRSAFSLGFGTEEVPLDTSGNILPPIPSLSWRDIRGSKSIGDLKNAQTQATLLSKSMDARSAASRYALINFIQGLSLVIQGGEKMMNADDVPAYLENLDLAVTTAFTNDRVDNGSFARWSNITVGPLLQNPEGVSLKKKLVPPFAPDFGLSSVKVSQRGTGSLSSWNHRGWMRDPASPALVQAVGYIRGGDISKISLYKDYQFVRDIAIGKQVNLDGSRTFKLPKGDARSIYTLRVYNTAGSYADQSYTFLSRAERFPWSPKTKDFAIPYGNYDPRVNALFILNRKGSVLGDLGDWVSF